MERERKVRGSGGEGEGRGGERDGSEGKEGREVETPLHQFLPTPLGLGPTSS